MKKLLGLKIDVDLKANLEKLAKDDNRSLSSFILNAVLIYVKEHHSIDLKNDR
jgi:hypothetical protein